jgi:hypothetical protein
MAEPRDDHDYVGEAPPAPPKAKAKPAFSLRRVLMPLASLRLTAALFVLSLILVFFGTLAQKRDSLNTVLDEYFYCYLSWLDLNLVSDFTQVFFRFRLLGTDQDPVEVRIPFPGGFTLGWVMVVNLTAAHVVRFKLSWRRLGLWVLHAGVIVLLAGEFVRANYAVEDRVNIREGQSANFLFSLDKTELAFLRTAGSNSDEVVSIPGEMLAGAAGRGPIGHPDLPFDVQVVRYMTNTKPEGETSGLRPVKPGEENPATAGLGLAVKLNAEKEISSVKGGGAINMAGCYVTLTDRATGQAVGTYVFGVEIDDPQPVGETGWRAVHRLKRTYLPYTIHAVKVERVNWPGTEKPKEFKSLIKIENPQTQEEREVLIEMNDPLRYEGRTFYQSSMDTGRAGTMTGLQVVQNPGATVPYVACILITVGMGAHFLLKLIEYLNRRARR